MEDQLPAGTPILGIGEHTAAILDLDADRLDVTGKGRVTIRIDGESEAFGAGSGIPPALLRVGTGAVPAGGASTPPGGAGAAGEELFRAALGRGSADEAVAALLAVESSDADRSVLRALITELGAAAATGLAGPSPRA